MPKVDLPIQMYDEFKRVLSVIKSVEQFEQYYPAKRYARLFFAKWEWFTKRDPSLFIDLHTQVLIQGKATLRSIRTKTPAV